jgi:hypothetical protein
VKAAELPGIQELFGFFQSEIFLIHWRGRINISAQ